MPRRFVLAAAVAAAFAGVALAAAPSATQAQESVFRTGTRTVPVYVTVTDAEGRLVPDLGREDFEIYDNGKLQTISIFANDIQPIMVVMMLDISSMNQPRAPAGDPLRAIGEDARDGRTPGRRCTRVAP